jgi:endonuclease/exonuclease/phosphatase family metal-dependent hydrolase
MFYSGLIFSQDLNVMSYNIRYGTSQDGENSWDFRKEKVVDLLNYYEASFIGLQEVQKFQLDYILEKMPTYDFIGLPRENEDLAEYSCILYNKNLFQLKEQKTIWLSKTPDTISKGWDAVCHRIVTYGLFECLKTKKEFWIANTHFDHEGKTARLESAKMIVELSKELKNKSNIPFILTGDFNATPKDDCIETLKKDLFEASSNSLSKPYGDLATWNAFDFKTKPSRQIDFIFFDKFSKIKVKKFKTISDFYNFKYPSDHFSILATFILD